MSSGTDKKALAKLGNSALALTLCKVAGMLIAMVAGMMMARFRTLEENGTLSQIQMAVTLAISVFTLGLPNSLNYFVTRAENDESRRKYLSVYYTLSTIMGLLIGLLLVLITPAIESYFSNPMISFFLYYLALSPWASLIEGSIENLLIAYGKTIGMVTFRTLHSVCYLGVVLLVQVLGGSFSDFMRTFIVFECVFTLAVYFIAWRLSGGLRFSLDSGMIRRIFAYSAPIGLAAVISTIDIELDKLVIGRFFTTAELGAYTYAARELPVTVASSALTAVLLPQLAKLMQKKDKQRSLELWSHAIYISLAIIALISAGCFVYAPDVITLMYSEKYLSGVTVFRIYSLVILLRCTYFGIILNTTGNTRFIMYSSISALALNVILNYALYYLLGFSGPAVATLLSVLTMNMVQLAFSAKIIKVPFSQIFPWKSCARLLLLNAAFGTAFYFVKKAVGLDALIGEQWESVVLGCVWGAIYFAVLFSSIKRHWNGLNSATLSAV